MAQSISSLPVSDWAHFKNILVLGVAGGSVIETLCTKFKFSGSIDAVDIDPVVLEIAKKDFNIQRFKNCNLILADANQFVANGTSTYDLLIIDLFLDDFMPDFVLQAAFIENLKKRVRTNGVVILNTLKVEKENSAVANNIRKRFGSDFTIQTLTHLNPFNTVFLLRKIKKA